MEQSQDQTGMICGIVGIAVAIPTMFIQFLGGMCCGWIGWPMGLIAIALGIVAIVKGARTLGILAIALSVIGVVVQILASIGLFAAISGVPPPQGY